MKVKRFDSSEGNVCKYVFDFNDAIAEAVLYKYESFYERTVLCISVQSGCPVGCKFCGTGKKFIRNLTHAEILVQVNYILDDMGIKDINKNGKRFQIMFMSMGEPTLNIDNVIMSISSLHFYYNNAELLISTMGTNNQHAFEKILNISKEISKVGLQFSIHRAFEKERNELIPYKNKLSLREIRDFGISWNKETTRPVYLNYCISDENKSNIELDRLKDLFSPAIFNLTFSVICSPNENMKEIGYKNLEEINKISSDFVNIGYNVRIFNPAGQDDIGGGCGQLWYVQNWIKEHSSN